MKSSIESALNAVEWEETCQPEDVAMADDSVPWVTHRGLMRMGGFEFRCYQLSNGQRIIDAEDVERFFGMMAEGMEP